MSTPLGMYNSNKLGFESTISLTALLDLSAGISAVFWDMLHSLTTTQLHPTMMVSSFYIPPFPEEPWFPTISEGYELSVF